MAGLAHRFLAGRGPSRTGGSGVRRDGGGLGGLEAPFLNPEAMSKRRERLVRRFAPVCTRGKWQVAEVNAFFTMLRCQGPKPISVSTGLGYENALRLFLKYVTDLRYVWPRANFVASRHMSSAPSRCGAEFTPPIAVDRCGGGYLHSHLIT